MPFSSSTFDAVLASHLIKIEARSVLDVGSGAGKYGRLLKQVLPNTRIEGIEPTKEYIEQYKLRDCYDEIHEMRLSEYCDRHPSKRHEVVIFGDVLEHFFRSEAIDYIDYFLYRSEWVIVIWPTMMPQDDVGGNALEIHKSNFGLGDLVGKFDVHRYEKKFGWFHWNDAEMTHCEYNYAVLRGYVTKRNVSL
jgi:hypothetical protein